MTAPSSRPTWPQHRSWPVTAGGRLRPTATTCAATSNGAAALDWRSSRLSVPTPSCGERQARSVGLAASTIDRRLSTICGFYRFAHIDGRIGANPAQYVRKRLSIPFPANGGTIGPIAATSRGLLSHALGVEDDVVGMAGSGSGTGDHVPRPPSIDHYLPVIVEHRRNIRGKHVVVRVKTM